MLTSLGDCDMYALISYIPEDHGSLSIEHVSSDKHGLEVLAGILTDDETRVAVSYEIVELN